MWARQEASIERAACSDRLPGSESASRRRLRPGAGALWVARAVALSWAGLVLGGCDSDSDSKPAPPGPPEATLPRELRPVAGMRGVDSAYERRPASCKTVRAIAIVDGEPKPRRLRARSGVCLFFGNKSSSRVWVRYARATGGRPQAPPSAFARPAETVHAEGPFEVVTARALRQIRRDEGGKFGCTTIYPESHYGARYYVAREGTVTIPYSLDPGGRGELVIERSRERGARLAAEIRGVRRLRCGRHAVDGRPAGCKRPLALILVDGKPMPAELKVARREQCVVWANKGRRALRIEAEPCPNCSFGLSVPSGSAAVTYFGAARPKTFPHRIRYTVRPEREGAGIEANGAIVLVVG